MFALGVRICRRQLPGPAERHYFLHLRLHPEVMQPTDGCHHFRHRGWYGGGAGVGIVSLAVHLVKMDLGVERSANLGRRTRSGVHWLVLMLPTMLPGWANATWTLMTSATTANLRAAHGTDENNVPFILNPAVAAPPGCLRPLAATARGKSDCHPKGDLRGSWKLLRQTQSRAAWWLNCRI